MAEKHKPDQGEQDEAVRDAVVAADDTGLISNEMQIVEVEIEEGEEGKGRR